MIEHPHQRYRSVEEAVESYLELCRSGAGGMDYADPIVQTTRQPVHIPPAMGKRLDLERAFLGAQSDSLEAHWRVWVWTDVHRLSARDAAARHNLIVAQEGGDTIQKSTILPWCRTVRAKIEEALAAARLWDHHGAEQLQRAQVEALEQQRQSTLTKPKKRKKKR